MYFVLKDLSCDVLKDLNFISSFHINVLFEFFYSSHLFFVKQRLLALECDVTSSPSVSSTTLVASPSSIVFRLAFESIRRRRFGCYESVKAEVMYSAIFV